MNALSGYLAAQAKIEAENRKVALQRNPVVSSFFNLDHIQNTPASVGPTPSLADSFDAGYQQQYRVDSPYSLEAELQDRWNKNLETLFQKTGKDYTGFYSLSGYGQYARAVKGEDQTFWNRPIFGEETSPEVQDNVARFKKVDEAIAKLNDPGVKTFSQLLDEVQKMQEQTEQQSAKVAATQGFGGMLAQFGGAMAGSFTSRDPVGLASLGIGGFGRSIATKIATEAAVNGGLAAITDWGSVNPNRALVGLPEHSVMFDALASAAGAGLITGAAHGIGYVAGRLLSNVDVPVEVHDATVRSVLEADGSPTARAGLDLLDSQHEIEAASPYGDSHVGTQRFLAELQDVQKTMGGVPQTAVARFLPPVPIEQLERIADFEIVREQAPDVWARLEEAKARVAAVDTDRTLFIHGGSSFDKINPRRYGSGEPGNIRPLGNGLYGFVAKQSDREGVKAALDYASRYAEKYGKGKKAVHVYEADLTNSQVRYKGKTEEAFQGQPFPADEQAWLIAYGEADKLPRGPERIAAFDRAKQLQEAAGSVAIDFKGERLPGGLLEMAAHNPDRLRKLVELPPGKELQVEQIITAERKAANEAYRTALSAVEAERARIREASLRVQTKANVEAAGAIGYSLKARGIVGPLLQHEVVADHALNIETLAATQDDRALLQVHALTSPDGEVDIGLRKPVPETFALPVGENGEEMTIRQILDDLGEDEKLEEAMRNCLL